MLGVGGDANRKVGGLTDESGCRWGHRSCSRFHGSWGFTPGGSIPPTPAERPAKLRVAGTVNEDATVGSRNSGTGY